MHCNIYLYNWVDSIEAESAQYSSPNKKVTVLSNLVGRWTDALDIWPGSRE